MGDSGLNGLKIASMWIVAALYVFDILYYTVIVSCWGIGVGICKSIANTTNLTIVVRC